MKRIIFATGNEHKLVEIREILKDQDVEILSMKQAGIDVDIVEDGTSFLENALIKARAVAAKCDAITMADDSGLEVDYLGKEPGIYSSRWMGEDTSYHIKNAKLVELLEGVPMEQRTARFVCAIACVLPDGRELTAEENFEGAVGYQETGENGFGYDPIFYLPERGCYSAELTPEEKNAVSHRGRALRAMREKLLKEL